MGWLIAGIICCNINHGFWGTVLILIGVLDFVSNYNED